ncbi:hypothetical protein GTG23_02635 [Rhodococcus hoagii]|nr:hypothetical protein [Prescottella equi]NKZ63453.1 hypothetical protein [Prescottella equi]
MSVQRIEFLDELPARSVKGNNAGRPPKWKWFADELRAHPGRWAKFPDQDGVKGGRTFQINSGRLAGFTAGEFEASVRQGVLYVRFVGGAE